MEPRSATEPPINDVDLVELYEESRRRRGHDVGRLLCSQLLPQAEAVYSRFGEGGLCYYVLHQYLDKLPNILRGRLLHVLGLHSYRDSRMIKEEFIPKLRSELAEGLKTEVSALLALELVVSHNVKSFDDIHKVEVHYAVQLPRLSRSTRHRKKVLLRAMLKDCYLSLTPRNEAIARLLVRKASSVRTAIVANTEWVLCMLVEHEPDSLAKGIERSFVEVLRESLTCK